MIRPLASNEIQMVSGGKIGDMSLESQLWLGMSIGAAGSLMTIVGWCVGACLTRRPILNVTEHETYTAVLLGDYVHSPTTVRRSCRFSFIMITAGVLIMLAGGGIVADALMNNK